MEEWKDSKSKTWFIWTMVGEVTSTRAAANRDRWREDWEWESGEVNRRVCWSILIIINFFSHPFQEGARIAQPFFIFQVLSHITGESTESITHVYLSGLGVCGTVLLHGVLSMWYTFLAHHTALKMKTALEALLYRKVCLQCLILDWCFEQFSMLYQGFTSSDSPRNL